MESELLKWIAIQSNLTDKIEYLSAIEDISSLIENEQSVFDILSKTTKSKNPSKTSIFQEYKQRIWQVNHEKEIYPEEQHQTEEEELIIANSKFSDKCPITLNRFEEPMINSTCGHSYSANAIKQLLSRSRRSIPCPVAGCSKQVSQNSISLNSQLVAILASSKRRRILEDSLK